MVVPSGVVQLQSPDDSWKEVPEGGVLRIAPRAPQPEQVRLDRQKGTRDGWPKLGIRDKETNEIFPAKGRALA